MKKLILAFALLATPAIAQDPYNTDYYVRPPQSYGNVTFYRNSVGNYMGRTESYGRTTFYKDAYGNSKGMTQSYGSWKTGNLK